MSTIKVDTIATRTGSGTITVSNDLANTGHASIGASAVDASRALTVAGATDGSSGSGLVVYNSSLASKFAVRDDGLVSITNNATVGGTLGVTGTGGVSGGTAAVAYGDADDLVIGNGSGNRGMSIYTGTSNAGSIYFSDASSGTGQYDGYISYNHNNRTMVAYSGINYGLNIDGVNKTVRLTDGGTQRLRIDNDGIKFGTDSAAVNALDDYEEGTFTPSLSTDSTTYAGDTDVGQYTKIGDIVYIVIRYTKTGTLNSGINARMSLPFTSKSGSFQSCNFRGNIENLDTAMAGVAGTVGANQSILYLQELTLQTTTPTLAGNDLGSGFQIQISGFYKTA